MSRTTKISLGVKVMVALTAALSASLVPGLALAQGQGQATVPADQSAEFKRGRLLYIQCRACHDLQPSPVAKVGPNLAGIMGRSAGKAAEFAYSPALKSSTLVWDKATLDRWLEKPSALAPGNTMAFAGIANPADRAALIRYIESESALR
ncbi:MAG: c-type cytochrome [Gammaproteobacteria bacterium]|nr:c-type cytochrome [Gammaproteobacteria bacterium]